MSGELEIVAIGARTPVGLVAETTAAAVRAKVSRIAEYPFVTADGEPLTVAADARLSAWLEGAQRLAPLARAVIDEVARKLVRALQLHHGAMQVWLSLPEARPGLSEFELADVVEQLRTELRAAARVELVGRGHAGVARAIEHAGTSLDDDALAVIVGVDSYLHPDTLAWLEHQRCCGPAARNGFHPGEAAGCLVLARTPLRRALHLPCLAVIDGVATAREPLAFDRESGCFGAGMTEAVMAALARRRLPDEAADTIYSDINGERHRSEEWGFVKLRAPAAVRVLGYEAPADCWGDVGAASGALFGVLAVRSWARGYAPGPRALAMTGSISGLRGVISFRQAT